MTHQPIDDNAGEYRWPLPTAKHPDPAIADRPAYIARCRACRGMIGCCATDGILVNVADFVAECIKGGATIHYGTAADVWAATWCTCQNDDGQPMLFSDERRVIVAGWLWADRVEARQRIERETVSAWADEYQREAAALDAECGRLRNQVATLQMLYAERTRELLAANYRIIATNVAWKRRRPDSEEKE